MERIGRSYYGEAGVRQTCHDVKQTEDQELRNRAIKVIARDFIGRNIVRENDVLIPAPQHTGDAEYTKEIAEIISAESGAKVADILKCVPHASLYEQKYEGGVPQLELYAVGGIPDGNNVFFIDNVISTGTTFRAANQLLGMKLKPLVYAVDETKNPDLGIVIDFETEKRNSMSNQKTMFSRNIRRKR